MTNPASTPSRHRAAAEQPSERAAKHATQDESEERDGRMAANLRTSADGWTPSSWTDKPIYQQHDWDDDELRAAKKKLEESLPLVFAGEARSLQKQLAEVCKGEAFLLQAGDCAESFDTSADSIRDTLKVMLQMSLILTYAGGLPVVKIGRIAGQYAKPRSCATETRGGTSLPSFMGHMINDVGFSESERIPNPKRMLEAYERSASTLNLVRAFTRGGFAHLNRAAEWNREFVKTSPAGERYAQLTSEIDKALQFMNACGVVTEDTQQLQVVDLFSSHEALVLDYEEPLARKDSTDDDKWYDCSAHMLWIGSRSLKPCFTGHIEFLRGVNNPVGCKIGSMDNPRRVVELCEMLNPSRVPGRLTLIVRMGAKNVETYLPPVIEAVTAAEHPVVWVCDPMHGNTYTTKSGQKTRDFESILAEINGFFAVHAECGTWPGGVHLELTGDHVTECIGGSDGLCDDDLFTAFNTLCDPRLNANQSVDLAFEISEMLRERATAL